MCKLVIDTGVLTRNLEKLRHYTSARIIAVVKGGGYGLGLAPYAQWLTAQGVDMLAVSSAAEAAALRDAGITADVLMLSSTALPEEVSVLLARNVILTVGSFDAAHTVSAVAAQQGVTARVHIKLDTGMGRCGFLPGDVREAAALLRFLPALRVEGVFTHFADAANRRRTAASPPASAFCAPPVLTPACVTSAPLPPSCGIRRCIWTRYVSARRCWDGSPYRIRWDWRRSAGWRRGWQS